VTGGCKIQPAKSGGKAFAALGAARFDYGATTLGGHACPKAMTACSLYAAGLKSTLHLENLYGLKKDRRNNIKAVDTRGE